MEKSPIEPSAWTGVFKGKELTEGPCGEGDPLPRGKELTEGPFGRKGSLTRTQIARLIVGVKGIYGVREGLWKEKVSSQLRPGGFMDLARGWLLC